MATDIIRDNVTWYDATVAVPAVDREVLVVYQKEDSAPYFMTVNYSQKYQAWNVCDSDTSHAMQNIRYWTDLTPPQMKGETDG